MDEFEKERDEKVILWLRHPIFVLWTNIKILFKKNWARLKNGHFDSQDFYEFIKIRFSRVAKWGCIVNEAF